MISESLLNLLKSHVGVPDYAVIIKDIKVDTKTCNQESITFVIHQVKKPLTNIESGASVIEREFVLTSDLDIDKDNLYYTKLSGYVSSSQKIQEATAPISSHYIEVSDTNLKKTIDIEFTGRKEGNRYVGYYINQPKVLINIDEAYEKLYRNISYSYNKTNNKYTGVTITFNSLKNKVQYPKISIIIIGDEK